MSTKRTGLPRAKAVTIGQIAKSIQTGTPVSVIQFSKLTGLSDTNARARLKILVEDGFVSVNKKVTPHLYSIDRTQKRDMLAREFTITSRLKPKANGQPPSKKIMALIEVEARREYCEHLLHKAVAISARV